MSMHYWKLPENWFQVNWSDHPHLPILKSEIIDAVKNAGLEVHKATVHDISLQLLVCGMTSLRDAREQIAGKRTAPELWAHPFLNDERMKGGKLKPSPSRANHFVAAIFGAQGLLECQIDEAKRKVAYWRDGLETAEANLRKLTDSITAPSNRDP